MNSVFCKERLGEFCTLKSFPAKAGAEGRLRFPGRAAGPLGFSSLESSLTPGQASTGLLSAHNARVHICLRPGVCELLFVELGPVERLPPPKSFPSE